jgi:hypothetical protein
LVVQVGGVKAELQERLRQHLIHLPSEDAPSPQPPASTKLELAHEKEEEEEEDEEEEEEGAFAAVTQMSQETDDGTQVSQESDHETLVGRDLPTMTPTVSWDADGGRVAKVLQGSSAGSRFMVSLSVAVSLMLSGAVSVISIRLYPHVGGKHGVIGPECISMPLHVACACRAHMRTCLNPKP